MFDIQMGYWVTLRTSSAASPTTSLTTSPTTSPTEFSWAYCKAGVAEGRGTVPERVDLQGGIQTNACSPSPRRKELRCIPVCRMICRTHWLLALLLIRRLARDAVELGLRTCGTDCPGIARPQRNSPAILLESCAGHPNLIGTLRGTGPATGNWGRWLRGDGCGCQNQ